MERGKQFALCALFGLAAFFLHAATVTRGAQIQVSRNLVSAASQALSPARAFRTQSLDGAKNCQAFQEVDAGAKIQACVDSLPPTGGIADARSITGVQNAAATITLSKPVTLLLGSITLGVTASPAINITSPTGQVAIRGIPGRTVVTGAALKSAKNIHTGMIWADYRGRSQPSGIEIEGLTLVGGPNGKINYKVGIALFNVTKAALRDNTLTLIDSPEGLGGDSYNIQVADASTDVDIENNSITMAEPARVGTQPFKVGILLQSPIVDASNGLYTGVPPLLPTTKRINVRNNYVYGGTHGLNAQNVAGVTFTGNRVQRQGHRNIILSGWTNEYITVTNNVFYRAGSCNLLGVGKHVTIRDNTFDVTLGGEGDNIESYYGSSDWTVSGNILKNAAISGIRLGYYIKRFTITGNQIYDFGTAEASSYAGIRLEGAMGVSYPDTIPGGGVIEDIVITGNSITNTLSDGRMRSGILVLGKEAGSLQGSTPIRRVRIAGNTFSNVHHGVVLQKNGDDASWDVTVGHNNCQKMRIGCQDLADYTDLKGVQAPAQ